MTYNISFNSLHILDKQDLELDKMPIFSNISLPSIDQLSNEIIESSISNSSFEYEQVDNNYYQKLLEMPM
jgi:hypothetical protein